MYNVYKDIVDYSLIHINAFILDLTSNEVQITICHFVKKYR